MEAGPRAASREVGRLVGAFGRANVAVELWDHGDPLDTARNDALALLAAEWGIDAVATNNVHYAAPARPTTSGCRGRGPRLSMSSRSSAAWGSPATSSLSGTSRRSAAASTSTA